MTKAKAAPWARYTMEFKQEAVHLVESSQSIAAAARTLGVLDKTLFNWVKAKREGKLTWADSKPVSAEQMEITRPRAELARDDDGAAAPAALQEPAACHGRSRGLDAQVQPNPSALYAGLRQPNAVRRNLAGRPTPASQRVVQLRDTEFRGKVMCTCNTG
jgi:transposase